MKIEPILILRSFLKMNDWNAEDVFIQKVLASNLMTYDFKLQNVIRYLEISTVQDEIDYLLWRKICDASIGEFNTSVLDSQPISFKVNYVVHSHSIDKLELLALKEKIKTNELSLVQRVYQIAINEAQHTEDELNDER